MARLWPRDPLSFRTLPQRLIVRHDRHGRTWGSPWTPEAGGTNATPVWSIDLYAKRSPWRIHVPGWPAEWSDPNP